MENVCDLLQRKPQLPEHKDHIKPFQGLVVIQPVTGSGDLRGLQQADAVVVVQRPDADPGAATHFLHGKHGHPSLVTLL